MKKCQDQGHNLCAYCRKRPLLNEHWPGVGYCYWITCLIRVWWTMEIRLTYTLHDRKLVSTLEAIWWQLREKARCLCRSRS